MPIIFYQKMIMKRKLIVFLLTCIYQLSSYAQTANKSEENVISIFYENGVNTNLYRYPN